jgi:hypothetical protein
VPRRGHHLCRTRGGSCWLRRSCDRGTPTAAGGGRPSWPSMCSQTAGWCGRTKAPTRSARARRTACSSPRRSTARTPSGPLPDSRTPAIPGPRRWPRAGGRCCSPVTARRPSPCAWTGPCRLGRCAAAGRALRPLPLAGRGAAPQFLRVRSRDHGGDRAEHAGQVTAGQATPPQPQPPRRRSGPALPDPGDLIPVQA